ncbi:conserved hypothetical protein [Paraburkholderia sacchari]|uniref:hypothetical protein n=1 Tax=Paraburkholderia sacchari TaxID=159450 RepID=UPI0039A4BB5F
MYQQQSTYSERAGAEFQEGNILSAFAEQASVVTVSQDCTDGDSNAAVQQRTDHCQPIALTVLLSPVPVTKSFSLSPEGEMHKQTRGKVSSGDLHGTDLDSIEQFADLLQRLTPRQCCIYGVAPRPEMRLMTQSAWESAGRPENAIPRTASAFAWPDGPGVLMLDYDTPNDGTKPLHRDELFALLHAVCPALAECDSLWMSSTSSEIYNSETGECLAGTKGQRIYFFVEDATDIPRAGKELLIHLWAAGHGNFEVSSSGAFLERGVFDATVWQTNRIDFAGGADCEYPLKQRRVPVIYKAARRMVDSHTAIPTASVEIVAAANKRKAAAKAVAAPIAARKRQEWRESRYEHYSNTNPAMSSEAITRMLDFALDPQRKQLLADWSITVVDTDGTHHTVTVAEVLADPQRYDGMQTLDPLEADYDGARPVGKLYLSGRQNLYSFAHGGVNFALCNKIVKIEKRKGYEREMADEVMAIMRDHPEIYEFGTAVVRVIDGKPVALNENSLRYWLGGMVQFYRVVSSNGHQVEVLEDPSDKLFKMILSPGVPRNFKRLNAVISAPTLRPDGTPLDVPGYDQKTGLLLQVDQDGITVPLCPTEEQARKALQKLWYPFERFPFVDEYARAAHLAGLLTAAIRPAVRTAPAFGYDAPTQGSGKTLLADCVALLTTGIKPDVFPPLNDDAEMRKRLFSSLLAGDGAIVLDNIVGTFDSASMAAMLTAPQFKDRVLAKSEVSSVPNNAVVLLTGNNMVLAGDMARRVIVCRIDANIETPFGRSFDVDPFSYCQTHRLEMMVAALTLIRFCLSSSEFKPAAGRVASFEDWDKLVRQTVIHVGQTLAPDQFGDVMHLLKQNQSEDPDRDGLRDLLLALRASFGTRVFTASEVFSACNRASASLESTDAKLNEAVLAVSPNPKLSTSGVGRLLRYRRDRICDGLSLQVGSDNKNGRTWRVAGASQRVL